NVLPHLHLAGVNSDGAAGGNLQPGGDLLRHRCTGAATAAAGFLLRRRGTCVHGDADKYAAAENAEQITPVELKSIHGWLCEFVSLGLNHWRRHITYAPDDREWWLLRIAVHCAPPCCDERRGDAASADNFAMWAAAAWIAALMRGYVPQRQTFPSIARTISASVGFGVLFS